MKFVLSCLVVLGSVVCNLAIRPTCDCVLHTPSKSPIATLSLASYTPCAPDDTSCTCEQRSDACMEACFGDANVPRYGNKRIRWRDIACSRENRLILRPGVLMLAGSTLSWTEDCPSPVTQYRPLPRDPLCCRLEYEGYISANC